jgi:hypothetical protein
MNYSINVHVNNVMLICQLNEGKLTWSDQLSKVDSHGWMVVAFSDFAHSVWQQFGLFELFQKVFAWHQFVFFLWYCQDVFSYYVFFWRFSLRDWFRFPWFVLFWAGWVLSWFGTGFVVFCLLPGVDGEVEFLCEVFESFLFEEVEFIFHWVLLVLVGFFHFLYELLPDLDLLFIFLNNIR